MKPHFSLGQLPSTLLVVALLVGFGALKGAQSPRPAASAPPNSASVCGGQPLCSETADFAAIISDFRVSTSGGIEVIDTTVHFQNKTNQPLILGYANGSGLALDDQGNRFGINGYAAGNGVQGIGQVAGNNIDPKFVLQPGGVGDARFELVWRTGPTAGVTYELDLTIREVTALEGRQFAVGGEFPLRFQGLANGMFGTASAAPPGQALVSGGTSAMPAVASASAAPGQAPCGPAAGNASSTLSSLANSVGGQNMTASAASAITSLRSIFGHKKAAAAPAPAPNANSAPCVPAANNAAAPGAVNAAAPNVPAQQAAVGSPAVAAHSVSRPATANVATTRAATRAATPAKAPAPTAKPATKPAPKKPAATSSTQSH